MRGGRGLTGGSMVSAFLGHIPSTRAMVRVNWALALLVIAVGACFATPAAAKSDEHDLVVAANRALGLSISFFARQVAVEGAYVWGYSEDLSTRRGEGGKVGPTIGWVQPPAGADVGEAFLNAYAATENEDYLEAAYGVAQALVRSQLLSGGWWYWFDVAPENRRAWCYRASEPDALPCEAITGNRHKNSTTLDDDTTQSALRFLIRMDTTLAGTDRAIRDAVVYGLEQLRLAQYPNGAWPPDLSRAAKHERVAADVRARYPENWSRTAVPIRDPLFFSLNDDLMANTVSVFLHAYRHYGDPADLATAGAAGDFLLRAQMPSPQPGWALVYNGDMEPIWDRAFEPPAIASRETARCVRTLIELAQATGQQRYLDAVGPAVSWLKDSRLPNGEWARFYELETNQPLYVTNQNELSYSDADLLSHYKLRAMWDIPEALAAAAALARRERHAPTPSVAGDGLQSLSLPELALQVRPVVAALDSKGRWIEDGMIDTATFTANVNILAAYLEAISAQPVP